MSKPNNILAISDISLGYGSPQILSFLQSLAEHYDTNARVIETDESHRPPVDLSRYDRLKITRSISAQPYWCLSSHIERNFEAQDIAKKHRPDVIVLFSPLQLPLLKKIGYKPKFVILYLLEIDTHIYGRALRLYWKHVDRMIFPEYERMSHVLGEINSRPYPASSLIYNVVDRSEGTQPLPASQRNGKIIYSGTLSRDMTFGHEFFEETLNDLPFDLYGNFSGEGAAALRQLYLGDHEDGNVEYKGYVSSAVLREVLPHYAYSVVRWNPGAGINYHYACPNKFFEAIAYGVPPIAAPHPQCVQIINNYECGILAEDFTAKGLRKAVKRGLDLYNTPAYERMVERCLDAHDRFLNWKTQFARFAHSLPVLETE